MLAFGVRRLPFGVWRLRSACGRFRDSWSAASLARPTGVAARGRIGVPKGLNDRTDSTELAEVQAIHCLEWVSKKTRPVSFSLIYASNLGIGRNHAS
jgi:hypothetical protein